MDLATPLTHFVDISHWKLSSRHQPKGSTVLGVYINPTDQCEYLFKSKDPSAYPDITKRPKSNINFVLWSEIIGGHIGRQLGINHVLYYPAKYNNIEGTICKIFTDLANIELHEIEPFILKPKIKSKITNEIGTVKNEYSHYKEFRKKMYSLPVIINAVKEYQEQIAIAEGFPPPTSDLPKYFGELVILDFLVGNNDRHGNNIGVLVNHIPPGEVSMSPVFDTVFSFDPHWKSVSDYEANFKDLKLLTPYKNKVIKANQYAILENEKQGNHLSILKTIVTESVAKSLVLKINISEIRTIIDPIQKSAEQITFVNSFFSDLELRISIIKNMKY